ncbi:unnamed protein product [Bemisia tabaci]|uniref:Protein-L-isoaspartate O-methyltransferase domain-containing protein 1 n=1 Tax=Bemisia tabaci TaxID=7038 RepID=A0A9P0AJM6_BEMTA|nr:unnamed protein product [Bemisia tabaci]
MGGSISTGANNDELVDNLLEVGRIKSELVERISRSVDRAFYFFPVDVKHAYKDFAWRRGNTHLSAPCIYSEVMENLDLEPGLSFLNIGSGTGYLSTMIGLVLGSNGVNHGIELHEDVINYAHEKLELFKTTSNALDAFDFCEPVFVKGNSLNLKITRQYDRVYCGAECPKKYQPFINDFIKVGGVLVMPIEDTLMKYKRIDETRWVASSVLPVSFAPLIIPEPDDKMESVSLPSVEPLSLQALCRAAIRNTLRSNAKKEHPEIDNMNRTRPKKKSNQKWSPLTRVTALPISVSDFVGRHEAELNSTFGSGDFDWSDDSDDASSSSSLEFPLHGNPTWNPDSSDNNESSNHSNVEENQSQSAAEPGNTSPKKSTSKRESAASSDAESNDSESGGLKKRTKRDSASNNPRVFTYLTFQSTPEESSSSSFSFTVTANEETGPAPTENSREPTNNHEPTGDVTSSHESSFSSATSNEMEVDEHILISRRIVLNDSISSSSDSEPDDEDDTKRTKTQEKNESGAEAEGEDAASKSTPAVTYSTVMKAKVKALPLPHALKCYLNYYREF